MSGILNVGDIVEYNRGALTVACQMHLGNKHHHTNRSEIWYWANTIRAVEMMMGKVKAKEFMDTTDTGIIQSISGKGYYKIVTMLSFTQGQEITLPYRKVIKIFNKLS